MKEAAMRDKDFNPGAGDKAAAPEKPVTSAPLEEQEKLAADDEHREGIKAGIENTLSKKLVDIDGASIFADTEELVDMLTPESYDALADLGVMIAGYNQGIGPEDAARMALIMADPDDKAETFEDQRYEFKMPKRINEANKKAGIDIAVIRLPDGTELELPGNLTKTLILEANRGLYNAAKDVNIKNANMTTERANTERIEKENKTQKLKLGGRQGGRYGN
jgi:hypothetical protein